MNFSWDRLQLTGALEGSGYGIICTSTLKALAYQINLRKSQSIAVQTEEIANLQNHRVFDNYRLVSDPVRVYRLTVVLFLTRKFFMVYD